MSKKVFEVSWDFITRMKLFSSITPGGFIRRKVNIKNGSESSLMIFSSFKDVPDECRFPIGSFSSFLSICSLLKKNVIVDYTDFDLGKNIIKIKSKDDPNLTFNYVVADSSVIDDFNSEMDDDIEYDIQGESNEFNLTSDQISFLISAGSKVDADCIRFFVKKDEMWCELYNTEAPNPHVFSQRILEVDIGHSDEMIIDFNNFNKLDMTIDYNVKVMNSSIAIFSNEVQEITFLMSNLKSL